MELSEKQIQDSIFDFLVRSRCLTIRINQGAAWFQNRPGGKKYFVQFLLWAVPGLPKSNKGVSDIIALSPKGTLYAFEVKKPGRRETKEQRYFLEQVNERGGIGRVVRDVQEVIDLLNDELGHVLL